MSVKMSKTQKMDDGFYALLIWRNLKISDENINSINKSETICNFRPFPRFTIIRLRSHIEKYRDEYTRKTKKDWRVATINDIFKADMVW